MAAIFDVTDYIQGWADQVDESLRRYVPEEMPPHPKVLFDAMRHSLLCGGKRIRPVFVIAACELVDGTPEMVLPTACAVEMIHTMSLMHDDLPAMDNADLRRGRPPCHKVYGEAVALLAGNALLAQALALIARMTEHVPTDRVLRAMGRIGTLLGPEGVVGGQVADLQSEGLGSAATLDVVEYIHIHKTAMLLEAAVYAGACIGGASDEELETLGRFARRIGLAFQIVDDILDCTGSTTRLGKAIGRDSKVSKATYVAAVGLDESRTTVQRLITQAKADLVPWGDRAIPMMALADFVGTRTH